MLAGIATVATRQRKRGFYAETAADEPGSIKARLGRWGDRGGWTGGAIQDGTFTRMHR